MAINLLIALNFLVFVAVQAGRIVFSLYSLSLGASASQVGGILAMLFVFPLLLSWPVGVLSDRLGARRLLFLGTGSGVAGMFVPYFMPSLATLYVAAALLGLTIAFFSVIGQNLVGILSDPRERTKNFSNFTLFGALSSFVGPLIAGLAIDHVGYAFACVVTAAPLMLSIAMIAAWGGTLPRGQPHRSAGGNLLHTLADRRLWRLPNLALTLGWLRIARR